jgi:hypothetical protein
MSPQPGGKSLVAVVALLGAGTAASLLLSIASLITSVQAKEASLPALAFDPARMAVIQSSRCADQAQNGIILTQYDVQYSVMVSNSGGRSASLLHATLVSGQHDETPWPVALTEAPTNFGLAIDGGHSTFIQPPADFAAGRSQRIAVNARLRFNEANPDQKAAADQLEGGSALHLTLAFSTGGKKLFNVPVALQHAPVQSTPADCNHGGDFHYQLDSQ